MRTNNKAETVEKKSKRTLTPKLRFPEFRDAPEWQEKPLCEMSERIVEKVGDAALTPVSITAGQGFVSQVEKFGRDISGVQYKNYILLRKGDFAYNKGNSKSYPQGCVRRLKEFDQAAVPSAFVNFRLHDGYVPEFFEGLFEKNAHGRQLIKFITSSARSDGLLNISPDEFFSVNLPMPQDPAEQQKIADCLGSLDALIAAEGRKLVALRDHKRGLMQQLFPQPGQTQPRLRFPQFRGKGEWAEKKLGRICKVLNNRRVPITSNDRKPGTYPYYGASGVVDWIDDYIFDERLVLVGEDGAKWQAFENTAFIAEGKYWVNNHAHVLKVTEVIDVFLEAFLTMADVGPFVTGTAPPKLTLAQLKLIPIPLPPTKYEQQKIANCLSALDNLIAAQAAKIESLKTHKRGLMQQLFPAPEIS